ncbi:MAG: Hsp70 family protein [Verrucomicrobia bacterium]|nr:Hsp70 family protein [Verrucomicrobiota bacterium]
MDTFIYGIDFGTSNSAVTIWNATTRTLVRDPRIAGVDASFLYFPATTRRIAPVIGNAAKLRYVEDEMRGRFFQAVKTILPYATFTDTVINNQTYLIEDLIALFLQNLKARGDAVTRQDVKRVILGRPAVFSEDPAEDQLAEERLRRAARLAGFEEIHFQYEPIAAAFAYEARITRPERVLVGDFGGGTSDFTVVQLDPARQGLTDRLRDILATGGLPIAGNKYDSATMWHKVTPHFGRGAKYDSWGKQIEVPDSLYRTICQWDQIVFLRNAKKLDLLWRLTGLSDDPPAFERFQALIKENQGFALFQIIEGAKIALTTREQAPLRFTHPRIPLDMQLTLAEFNHNSADLTAAITGYLDKFLSDAKIAPASIETVFLTGGTSLIRSLRSEFVHRFGAVKIRDGNEFTSVADGLALSAPLFFPELHP